MRELNKGSDVESGGEGEISNGTGFTFLPSIFCACHALARRL